MISSVFIDRPRLTDLDVLHTRQRLQQFGMTNTLYSLGREAAGLVCLHNYPRSLQRITRPDALLQLLRSHIPPEHRAPGTWMYDALDLRDQWTSRLLRTSAWSPLY